jgi:hypothetical protein
VDYVNRVEQALRLFQLEGRWEEATGELYDKSFGSKKIVQNCVGLHLPQQPAAQYCDHGDEALDSIKDGRFLYHLKSCLSHTTYFTPHVMKYVVIYFVLDPCKRLDAFRCAW